MMLNVSYEQQLMDFAKGQCQSCHSLDLNMYKFFESAVGLQVLGPCWRNKFWGFKNKPLCLAILNITEKSEMI